MLFLLALIVVRKKYFSAFGSPKINLRSPSVYEVDLLEVNFTEIENRLCSLYEEHVLVGEVGRIVAFQIWSHGFCMKRF